MRGQISIRDTLIKHFNSVPPFRKIFRSEVVPRFKGDQYPLPFIKDLAESQVVTCLLAMGERICLFACQGLIFFPSRMITNRLCTY